MTPKSVSVSAPFDWLMQTFDSVRRNPDVLLRGFALISIVALIPTTLQLLIQLAMPENGVALFASLGLSTILNLVLLPPLMGGLFRLLHAAENGQPARPGDVLASFAGHHRPLRMIGIGLVMLAINVFVLVVLFLLLPGKEFWIEFVRIVSTTPPGSEPDISSLPTFSPGMALGMLACFLLMLLISFVMVNTQMFANTRAALSDRGIFEALADGFSATLRNVLPLFLYAMALLVGLVVLSFVVGIVFGIVLAIASMISPVLGMLLSLPLYFLMFIAMYMLMLGFYYHGWREIFAAGAAPARPVPAHTVAL